MTPEREARFWAKVDKSDETGCWVWTGARGQHGHGHFWLGDRVGRAHRFSWELANGPIPQTDGYHGTCVCHRCDNPPCVNPAHLFLGSHKDNLSDAGRKGRLPRGRRHVHNRLTENQVLEVVERHRSGESQRSIARSFGMHPSSINRIFNGTAWAWLTGFHAGFLPHPTGVRQAEVQMPVPKRDSGQGKDLSDPHRSAPLQDKDCSSVRQTPTDADSWHIAEWDDVFWWYVADSSALHSPDLRRVAP